MEDPTFAGIPYPKLKTGYGRKRNFWTIVKVYENMKLNGVSQTSGLKRYEWRILETENDG
jgi:hypothetical protein